MNNKPKFYWTNPTADRHKGREVQLYIEANTNIILINPFYSAGGDPTEEVRALDNGEVPTVNKYTIVDRDLELIDNSDGLVAYVTDKTSWGSIQECFYSSRVIKRPTYIICDPESRNNINNINHPWIQRNATKVFGTIEGFVQFAQSIYGKPERIKNNG